MIKLSIREKDFMARSTALGPTYDSGNIRLDGGIERHSCHSISWLTKMSGCDFGKQNQGPEV